MDEALGRALIGELATIIASMDRMSELSLSIADEDERRFYRKSLGLLMAHCDSELIRPITRTFPQLNPLKD